MVAGNFPAAFLLAVFRETAQQAGIARPYDGHMSVEQGLCVPGKQPPLCTVRGPESKGSLREGAVSRLSAD